jgi:hypothetical protein
LFACLLVCSDMQFAPVLEFMAVRKRLGLDVRRFGVMLGEYRNPLSCSCSSSSFFSFCTTWFRVLGVLRLCRTAQSFLATWICLSCGFPIFCRTQIVFRKIGILFVLMVPSVVVVLSRILFNGHQVNVFSEV